MVLFLLHLLQGLQVLRPFFGVVTEGKCWYLSPPPPDGELSLDFSFEFPPWAIYTPFLSSSTGVNSLWSSSVREYPMKLGREDPLLR